MNIMIATNHEYVRYACVMLYSLFVNNEGDINVFLPYTKLSEEDFSEINKVVDLFDNKKLTPFKINEEFDNKVTSHNGISIETYYRILAINYIPDDIDRIFYLDVDMIIKGSLQELYDMDFGGNAFIVCEDILGIINEFHEANKFRMNIPKEFTYFNAGVMLFNLDYFRENNLCEKIIQRVYENQDKYEYNDQDVLNEMFYNKLVLAPWDKYNCPPAIYMLDKLELASKKIKFASYNEIKNLSANPELVIDRYIDISDQIMNDAKIIHYMGASKPWKSDKDSVTFNKFNEIYFKYESLTNNRISEGGKEFINDKTNIIKKLLSDNYTYYYLKNRLEKATNEKVTEIIAGSSYGVHGVLDIGNDNISNLSGPSQDLNASISLCKKVIEDRRKSERKYPKKIVLLLGYYALYDELSKSPIDIAKLQKITYEPLLTSDVAKNDGYSIKNEIRVSYQYLSDAMIAECEKNINDFFEYNDYFNEIFTREDNDRSFIKCWKELIASEKDIVSFERTEKHNHLVSNTEGKENNKNLLKEFISYLSEKNIRIEIIIPPFTDEYNRKILSNYKAEILEFLDSLPYEISFVDFNDYRMLTDEHFFDSDHLNHQGAKQFSDILIQNQIW